MLDYFLNTSMERQLTEWVSTSSGVGDPVWEPAAGATTRFLRVLPREAGIERSVPEDGGWFVLG